jgi:hypothetical protein
MEDVLGQDLLEVPATEDEKPVQALAAYRANKALRHRIRPWGSHRRLQYPDAVGTEHVVEADSELRVPVPDEELDRTGALGQYETQVDSASFGVNLRALAISAEPRSLSPDGSPSLSEAYRTAGGGFAESREVSLWR